MLTKDSILIILIPASIICLIASLVTIRYFESKSDPDVIVYLDKVGCQAATSLEIPTTEANGLCIVMAQRITGDAAIFPKKRRITLNHVVAFRYE